MSPAVVAPLSTSEGWLQAALPLATWAGQHALAVWAMGLAGFALVGALLTRLSLPSAAFAPQVSTDMAVSTAPASTSPHPFGTPTLRRLAARLLLALTILVLAGMAVAEIGGHTAAGQHLGRWDDALVAALASHRTPAVLASFALVSHLGDPLTITLVGLAVTCLLWRAQHRLLAIGWAVALIANGLITRLFKQLWLRVRPEHDHTLAVVQGYSFPSGHASAAAVTTLWLACLACWLLPQRWRWPAAVFACGLGWSIAFSRVVLQVHFASDVLAGLLVGAAWASASIVAVRGLLHWHHQRHPRPHTTWSLSGARP